MGKIKATLPNKDKLEQKFNAVLGSGLSDFLASTNVQREAVLGSRRYAVIAFVFAIAVILGLYVTRDNYSNLVANILTGCAMLWLTIVLLSAKKWLTNNRLLARQINMSLVPIFMNTLEQMLVYSHDEKHRMETEVFLSESSLMTLDNTNIQSDDIYTIYGPNEVSVRELLITQALRNGKSISHATLFKGVFVIVDLKRVHEAETYISTENDRVGFAHRDFWNDLLEIGQVKETVLESNDFENDLHVATSDPVKAREILTPDFMQHLHQWWQEHELNIRIAFKGSKMFMLLPENSIKIGTTTTSTEPQAIQRHAWSILQPIWRSLLLVEDIS